MINDKIEMEKICDFLYKIYRIYIGFLQDIVNLFIIINFDKIYN